MEKDKWHILVQHEESQLEELIDSSFQYYKDDITIEGDNIEELMANWKIKKKQKHFSVEKPHQQIVKDLIINTDNICQLSSPKDITIWRSHLLKKH